MFIVSVVFYAVGAIGLFTTSFTDRALCEYWVQSNATPLHRAVDPTYYEQFLQTGEVGPLPQCHAQ